MSPLPSRDTVVQRLESRYEQLVPGLLPHMSRKALAEASVDICLPQLNTRSCAGKSINELMWEQLDNVVARIYDGAETADGRDPGRAEGMAMMLAILQNPYRPNLELIREKATERYEQANPE